MKVGGDYRVLPYRNTWPHAAGDLGLDPERVVARVEDLAVRAPDAFAEAACAPEVDSLDRLLPGHLVDPVADRAEWCLALLRPASDPAAMKMTRTTPAAARGPGQDPPQ